MGTKTYTGPAILSFGFRPFFLLASLFAAGLVPFWVYMFIRGGDTAGPYTPLDWHVHEMIFGYLAAVITGFLLTAIPNWTGRLPVRGGPLLILVLLWLAGRAAMITPLPYMLAAWLDSLFLLAVAGVCIREIMAGKNWRNAPVSVIISLLAAANIAFHLEATGILGTNLAGTAAVALIVMLNALIGGRIVPSFTTNWLIKAGHKARPVPFNLYDKILLAVTALSLLAWILLPDTVMSGTLLLLAAIGHLVRLWRWKGWTTGTSAIVLVLHVAYLWLPLGLGLLGIGMILPDLAVPPTSGIHALTAGLMGMMPLAVMSRATLGHTGRPLAAGISGTAMYICAFAAAATRTLAPILVDHYQALLVISAILWCATFLLFVGIFGRMLWRPRLS
ncbi:short-chain dehydrogenase [Kordiimonas sediminis]|uniref:Short-chain dehydrogenase n=1 Tax=Kordiimonas sediminis TaxID=1735581 RepID=A0A919AK60_9PROT|nr:NnrS family protein [Kordiimonas sediminis]GHF13325.1 short-chain dehydrogenase [Kordiimonas sediminis]